MNKDEKIVFINSAMESLKEDMIKNIDKIPENWDGIELRWYIKDKVGEIVWKDYADKRLSRYKNYNNDVLVNNL